MKQKKILYFTLHQFVLFIYLSLTTLVFFLSLKQGHDGIALRIFGGGDDGFFYWRQANNIANGNQAVITSIYPLMIGYFIKFTGIRSVFFIRFINYLGFVFLSVLSVYAVKLIYLLRFEKVDSNSYYNSKILVVLSYLFYSSIILFVNISIYRDVWIYAFYTLSVILSIKILFTKNNIIYYSILLSISLLILGGLRNYAVLAFILSLVLFIIYRKIKLSFSILKLIIGMVIFLGVYYTFLIDLIIPILNMSLRSVLDYRLSALTIYSGGSQMWISLNQSNFILFIVNYFHSYFGNLIGPLPWHINSIMTTILFLVETIPMTLILVFLFKRRYLLATVEKYILLHSFVWIGLIAISNDNLGTGTRLRVISWILILVVFSVVYQRYKSIKITQNL